MRMKVKRPYNPFCAFWGACKRYMVRKTKQEQISCLQETVALSIEAHEVMRDELTKAQRDVKRLKNENTKLKKKLQILEKSKDEKINDT